MLRLRPYRTSDASIILSWTKEAKVFYQWSAGVLGDYPLSFEQFQAVQNLMAFTMIEDNEVVGFFTLRNPNGNLEEVRFGFVIVDIQKRNKHYGQHMLELGLKYAFEIYGAKKASLGVFANNPSAYSCYKKVGFTDKLNHSIEMYTIENETWECIELEIYSDQYFQKKN